MSVVWRAQDEVLGREVAVKVLAPAMATDTALLDRIRAEARAAARMCHPHIVNVHDYGEASIDGGPPLPYVVMEIVEGPSLADALTHGPLHWRGAVRACAEVASALAVAHARGIVHRDVTPGNVMLTAGGAKLVDFGISATVGDADIGPNGLLLGTPAYLAPERLDGGSVQPATDVYALGLLLYKSLTARLPWQSSTTTQMLTAHRYYEPAPLPSVPGLPVSVAQLCRQCLAKRPEDRPSSAEAARVLAEACVATATADMGTAWRGWAAAAPVTSGAASTTSSLGELMKTPTAVLSRWFGRWLPSRRRPAAAATAVGLLLLTAASSSLADPNTPPPEDRTRAGIGSPDVDCRVRYEVSKDSGGTFTAGVTLTNEGVEPVDPWRLEFAFPGDQRVLRGWAGQWHQSGQSVEVDGGAASELPAGRSVTLGFEANYRSANPLPTEFRVNGTDCAPELVATAATPAGAGAGSGSGSGSETGSGSSSGSNSGNGKGNRKPPQPPEYDDHDDDDDD